MISPKDKAALRNQLWQTLDQLSKLDQDNRSQKIQIHLKQFLIDHTFNLLGGFVPVRKEPNIWPLLEPLGPSLALPVYNPTLDLYEWGPFKPPLKQSKFNIPETVTDQYLNDPNIGYLNDLAQDYERLTPELYIDFLDSNFAMTVLGLDPAQATAVGNLPLASIIKSTQQLWNEIRT